MRQAQDALQWWTPQAENGANTIAEDTKILALNVSTYAGFGKSYPFAGRLPKTQTYQLDREMTYQSALSIVLQSILPLFVIPYRLLFFPFLPKSLRILSQAIHVFRVHVATMVERERALVHKRDIGSDNLVSALIRASEEVPQGKVDGESRQGLTDDEIFGNIFIYNLAGHKTTVNTLAYSILLLAAHPEYQEWLAEEIDEVLGGQEDIDTWKYEEIFPHLKRCLALLVRSSIFTSFSMGSYNLR